LIITLVSLRMTTSSLVAKST